VTIYNKLQPHPNPLHKTEREIKKPGFDKLKPGLPYEYFNECNLLFGFLLHFFQPLLLILHLFHSFLPF